ncbi:hypothetical protein [Kingella potus]|nr:hypothetical protein [Kingella potus]UOP01462.1 hypothetical protein LVJ84_04480 [Kingella potus]
MSPQGNARVPNVPPTPPAHPTKPKTARVAGQYTPHSGRGRLKNTRRKQ